MNFLFIKFIFLLIIIPFQLIFLYGKHNNSIETVAGIQDKQAVGVSVNATVGDKHLDLYGYTSPQALITVEGMGIFNHVYADSKGYFVLSVQFSSLSSREACLSSKDQFGRISSPACLPPFPTGDNIKVGPIIMPPTVSLDKKDYFINDEIILSGQAVPNTEIDLSVFGDINNQFEARNFSLIKPVEAFTFPELKVNSDNKGNFSINLPSSTSKKFRLFAQTNFNNDLSSNSNKLNLQILPIWMMIIKFIQPRLLEIVIILEIIYIVYLLKGHFQKKVIILYQNHLPLIKKNSLIKYHMSFLI